MRFYCLIILLFFLSGCVSQASQNHQHYNQSSYWMASGAIAARTSQQSWSAFLQWKQYGNNYQISLFGPLGTQSATLYGSPNYVRLETSDGKKMSAATPEELLIKQTGWNLPVSNLYYWMRGLPVPGIPAQQYFDPSYQLTFLQQCGWRVKYDDYQGQFPRKIYLSSSQINIKIVINNWQF